MEGGIDDVGCGVLFGLENTDMNLQVFNARRTFRGGSWRWSSYYFCS